MKYILIVVICILIYSFKPLQLNDIKQLENKTIMVEVKGHVNNSGIFELQKLSKISDLLELLQLNTDSDISHLNMNKRLLNNDVIIINKTSEIKKVSINSGTHAELITLKGVGPKIADRIIHYRENVSSFQSLEQLKEVKGIGDQIYENIKDFITL